MIRALRPGAAPLPAIRLLGPSGCGKTTLAERLVSALGGRGYRVGVVKSARHHREPDDRAGADTARLAAAGAAAVAGAFADGTAIRLPPTPLSQLLAMLAPVCDIALIEGFHDAAGPALVFDGAGRRAARASALAHVTSRRTRASWRGGSDVPRFHRDDVVGIAGLLLAHINSSERPRDWTAAS